MARLTKKHVKGLGKQRFSANEMAHKTFSAKSDHFNRNPPNREDRSPMQIHHVDQQEPAWFECDFCMNCSMHHYTIDRFCKNCNFAAIATFNVLISFMCMRKKK